MAPLGIVHSLLLLLLSATLLVILSLINLHITHEFELSNRFSVLSDLSSVLSVDSCFCPRACSTPTHKLDKPCLIDDPVKSNESIKVNSV